MRGLIYKDLQLFFRSVEKKLILIAAAAIVLLLAKAGVYGGLMGSIMFAMTVSMQNVMSFASDEKTNWRKYQLALPVSGLRAVASKYISVLCTLGISAGGGLVFSLVSCAIYGSLAPELVLLSVLSGVVIPLAWTGICLPLTYWFGFRTAQTMGLIVVVPVFYMIKYFEDGPGLPALTDTVFGCLLGACALAVVVFILSIPISTAGYTRKK